MIRFAEYLVGAALVLAYLVKVSIQDRTQLQTEPIKPFD